MRSLLELAERQLVAADTEAALATVDRALARAPRDVDGRLLRIQILLMAQRWTDLVSAVGDLAPDLDDDSAPFGLATLDVARAEALFRLGRRDEAIACAEAGLARRGDSGDPVADIARSLAHFGEFDRALVLLDRALPESRRVWSDQDIALWQGICHAGKGEFGAADERFRTLAMEGYANPLLWFHQARLKAAMGSTQQSKRLLQRFLLETRGKCEYPDLRDEAAHLLAEVSYDDHDRPWD